MRYRWISSIATRSVALRRSLGYTAVDDVDVLARLENADSEPAMAQFLALIPTLDMDA